MKIKVFLLLIVNLIYNVHAQVDTVAEFDPHYLYQYPNDSLMPYADTFPLCDRSVSYAYRGSGFYNDGDTILFKEAGAVFYYPGEHQIYGIAAMIQCGMWNLGYSVGCNYYSDVDTINWSEQLKLYNAKDRTTPLASGSVKLTDCDRSMEYRGCWLISDPTEPSTTINHTRYPKLLRVEFDSPITVLDSFIVSATNEYFIKAGINYPDVGVYGISTLYKWGCLNSYDSSWTSLWEFADVCSAQQYPINRFCYLDSDNIWHDYFANCVMQIFPIIDLPGDTCPAVSNVHITGAYGSLVMAEWETATNNSRWEVSYGPVGTEPDSGTIITCMEPVAKMLNLNVDSQYVAYVRPVCRFGITKRGEWSEGVVFNPLSGEVGIEQVADTEPLTMYPNPASGTVRIGLPDGQQGVDVRLYDMAGREVMHSTSLTLDVSHLPQGTYTVRAATATGTRTGRLVVAE